MERREFVFSSAAAMASLFFLPRAIGQTLKSLAAQEEYFLQITIPNGWDVLLATDPWISPIRPDPAEIFIDYNADDVGKISEMYFGPALRPLKNFLSRTAIINGIFVSKTSVDHIALRNYMITGSGTGKKAAAAIEFLAQQPAQAAWGLVTDDSLPSADYTIVKSGITGLSVLAAVDGGIYTGDQSSATPLQGSVRDYLSGLPLEKTYLATLKQLKSEKPDPELARGQVIASAFKAKLSRAAALTVSPRAPLNNLDTHTNHETNHLRSLTDVFRQIASVLETLARVELTQGVSLLSKTTVYITSEFSRSPSLNNSQGKEHNAFTNSALIMGPRIAGGRVIGGSRLITRAEAKATDSLHVGQYLIPKTGRVIAAAGDLGQGVLLKPETVMASLLLASGVSRNQLDSELKNEPLLETLFAKGAV